MQKTNQVIYSFATLIKKTKHQLYESISNER